MVGKNAVYAVNSGGDFASYTTSSTSYSWNVNFGNGEFNERTCFPRYPVALRLQRSLLIVFFSIPCSSFFSPGSTVYAYVAGANYWTNSAPAYSKTMYVYENAAEETW